MDKGVFDALFKSVRISQGREEFFWLVNEVEKIDPHIIIEIGVQYGGSLKFWEQLVKPGDLVIGLDNRLDLSKVMSWDYERSDRNVVLVVGNSMASETVEKVRGNLGEREADFLFIDGGHSFKAVSSDFENYSKFVREGGLVAFHDLYLEAGYPKKFFDTLKGKKRECHADYYGVGVWWK
ncbi:MAG: class I SAM-dependent methyltransferase [Candidatus Bathyarchaeota archaeon]|nr:class I SAM-dependent methyltransferase [Candidatus Bathyarchaeota archaeon]